MTYELKMDKKGRIQIPKDLREEMNLKPGQKLKIKIEDGNLVILKPISSHRFLKRVKKFQSKLKKVTDKLLKYEKLF